MTPYDPMAWPPHVPTWPWTMQNQIKVWWHCVLTQHEMVHCDNYLAIGGCSRPSHIGCRDCWYGWTHELNPQEVG